MATKNPEEIEEERRLFYVALTRAKSWLYVCCPLRYYHSFRPGASDRYGYAQCSRFLADSVVGCFEQQVMGGSGAWDEEAGDFAEPPRDAPGRSAREQTKDLWS